VGGLAVSNTRSAAVVSAITVAPTRIPYCTQTTFGLFQRRFGSVRRLILVDILPVLPDSDSEKMWIELLSRLERRRHSDQHVFQLGIGVEELRYPPGLTAAR
jgi:hypothetical protein